ncbi:hypothetical protein BH10PAT2_BH10PAT2_3390 [soil metagenome]
MNLTVASTVGQTTTMSVNDAVFGAAINPELIAQAVRVYQSNQRQGSSKVLTRSEVARTKKKWFKQKGTGNARHGARTPNIFVGGGVAHGPTGEQNWSLKLSASMRKAALISSLSAQVNNITVTDDLNQLDGKTSSAQKMLLKMLPDSAHILVVVEVVEPMLARSLRNLANVFVITADRLTTYDIVSADGIVMTKNAVKVLEDRLTKKASHEATSEAAAKNTEKVLTEKPSVKTAKAATKKAAKPAVTKPKTETKPKATKKVAEAK